MTAFEQIKSILQAGASLTDQEIAELTTVLSSCKGKVKNKGTVPAISQEQQALLAECTAKRCEILNCPRCGSISVIENGRKSGRQRYFCKDCGKTFGDTHGTMLYHSKLSLDKWKDLLHMTMYNQSLRTIRDDLHISIGTAWYNRHKACELLLQLECTQDSFPSITEGDEYYTPLSFLGERRKDFFLDILNRMPRHNRSRKEKLEYLSKAGYANIELDGMDEDAPSERKISQELNLLTSEEKRKRGISNQQVCILTCIDRGNNLYLSPTCVGRVTAKHIGDHLDGRFEEDSILVTDSHSVYRGFAKKAGLQLEQIPAGKHTKGAYNLARVNSCHSRLNDFMKYYKEVASKYLDHYLALFRWQDKHREGTTIEKVMYLLDMLTEGANRVGWYSFKNRPFPFDTKNLFGVAAADMKELPF